MGIAHLNTKVFRKHAHICNLNRNYSEKPKKNLQKWIQSPHSPSPATSSKPTHMENRLNSSERRKPLVKAAPLVTIVLFRTLQPVRPVQSLRWSFTLLVTACRFASKK